MNMSVAALYPSGFHLESLPIPHTPAPNQILIKMQACGICSGDLFEYTQRKNTPAPPRYLGHEASGEVIAIGAAVDDLQIGQRVTSFANPAYREYFLATREETVPLPDNVSYQEALGEAMACCVHASWRFKIQSGHRVALVGCGFMGLMCQQLALLQGAREVVAFDTRTERLTMAKQLGASIGINPTTEPELSHWHDRFDCVIEAAGSQSSLDLATALVAEHGRMVLVGYHQSQHGMRQINAQQWNYKAIDVANGHVRRAYEKQAAMQQGMQLLDAGQITTQPLIKRFEFSQIQQAFEALDRSDPTLFKAVLEYKP